MIEKRKELSNTLGRSRDSVATQKAILDAAEREFASFGLYGARTEVIAADTGVTKAMIHHYFKTKENLYEAVVERLVNGMMQAITEQQLESYPPEEAIRRLLMTLIDSNVYPNYPGVMVHESLQNKGKYFREKGGLRLQWELIGIIKRGIADGVFRKVSPEIAAMTLLGAGGYFFPARYNLAQLFPTQSLDSKELHRMYISTAVDVILLGLKAN